MGILLEEYKKVRDNREKKGNPNSKSALIGYIMALFIILFVTIFLNSSSVYADSPTVKAEGILTSIEEDGTVIIDKKGYKVDRSVLVVNAKGRPIPLKKLHLPAKVMFEYRYAHDGFVIVYIEQLRTKPGIK